MNSDSSEALHPAQLASLLNPDLVDRELARRSLDDFARRMLGVEPARHHQYVNAKLEAVERGEIKRLMIFEPPGNAKSFYGSIGFPAWYRGRHADHHLIQASHTADLATFFGRRVRNLLGLPEWPWPEVRIAEDAQAAGAWATTAGGQYYAVGVGGAVTGRRAHGAVIDDPLKGRADADSATVRERLWQWYLSDLRTRLLPDGWMILIQTRWHEDDLAGRLLPADYAGQSGPVLCSDHETWEVVNLPALAEHGDPIGRQPGEPLWPEMYPLAMLEAERAAQTPRNWSALYQQRPAPEEGNYFKRDWLRWYDEAPPRDTLRIYGASDYAVTADDGDFTVHGVGGVDPDDNLYILDWWRGQEASDVWVETFIDMAEQWKPTEWAEESGQIAKSVGPFIERRQRERHAYHWRQQYPSAADKPTRAQAIRGRMAMGKVLFPRNAPWAAGLVTELLQFPTGKNDDQVDVLSLFGRILNRMQGGSRPTPPEKQDPPGTIRLLPIGDRGRERERPPWLSDRRL